MSRPVAKFGKQIKSIINKGPAALVANLKKRSKKKTEEITS